MVPFCFYVSLRRFLCYDRRLALGNRRDASASASTPRATATVPSSSRMTSSRLPPNYRSRNPPPATPSSANVSNASSSATAPFISLSVSMRPGSMLRISWHC
jgi:hypothetical protein